jgi:very-short-patch-repair endonuclease
MTAQSAAPNSGRYRITAAQELLKTHLSELGYASEFEYQFEPSRKWRFDLFLPEANVGIELDGGMFHGGHSRGAALERDYEKSNTAQLRGFRILRFTNRQVMDGSALNWLRENL